ncbi:TonB-dependent receptor domain-containing protein [Alkalilimnicola ehrlichii]|uniref:TonB-dependent receptor domain-containing protein n=1 Tax=Alkalilimnicola ehrlichii TaxID=351052 RepID=UPI001C6EAEA1|nr:TonB-dependent receptor [Alkalilimnicola ehrlichii]
MTVFYNEFEDKIASMDIPNCRVNNVPGCVDIGEWPVINDPSREYDSFPSRTNVDEAVTRGVEVSTRVPLGEAWALTANYTYTDSEQKSGPNAGDPLTDTPKHMVNAMLRWQTTERLNTWLRGEYSSKRHRATGPGTPQSEVDELGDFRAYSLFHLGAGYRVAENVTVNAAVYNMLNKDFVDYRSYEDGARYGNVYANNLEGRRLWLSTSVTF